MEIRIQLINGGATVASVISIHDSEELMREAFELIAAAGPIALWISYFLSGFAEHGLMYRRPRGER